MAAATRWRSGGQAGSRECPTFSKAAATTPESAFGGRGGMRSTSAQWTMTLTRLLRADPSTPVDKVDTEAILSSQASVGRERRKPPRAFGGTLRPCWTRARRRAPSAVTKGESRSLARPLDKILPKRASSPRRGHHAAMPYADVPAFSRRASRRGPRRRRGRWNSAILTAARSGEVLAAR